MNGAMNGRHILIGAVLSVVIAACADQSTSGGDNARSEATPSEEASPPPENQLPGYGSSTEFVMPYYTATDWVTYADRVVVVTVDGQRALETELDPEDNVGYIGRALEVTVEETVWSRPGAPDLPKPLEIGSAGWIQGGDGTRDRYADDVWPEVGHRYVIALGYAEGGWNDFAAGTTIAYDQGIIGGDSDDPDRYPEIVQSVWGQPVSALAQRLEEAKPDPYAAKYMDLPIDQRYQKALADRRADGN